MQFHRFRQLAVLAGALLLAGCVAEGGPDYRPPIRPGPSQPQMCPMIYAPVCATRGSSRKTFGNICLFVHAVGTTGALSPIVAKPTVQAIAL